MPYIVQAPKGFTVQDTRLSPKKLEELKNAIRNPNPISSRPVSQRKSQGLATEAAESNEPPIIWLSRFTPQGPVKE